MNNCRRIIVAITINMPNTLIKNTHLLDTSNNLRHAYLKMRNVVNLSVCYISLFSIVTIRFEIVEKYLTWMSQ